MTTRWPTATTSASDRPRAELVEQCEHGPQRLAMSRERLAAFRRGPVVGVLDARHVLADALDETRRQARTVDADRPART